MKRSSSLIDARGRTPFTDGRFVRAAMRAGGAIGQDPEALYDYMKRKGTQNNSYTARILARMNTPYSLGRTSAPNRTGYATPEGQLPPSAADALRTGRVTRLMNDDGTVRGYVVGGRQPDYSQDFKTPDTRLTMPDSSSNINAIRAAYAESTPVSVPTASTSSPVSLLTSGEPSGGPTSDRPFRRSSSPVSLPPLEKPSGSPTIDWLFKRASERKTATGTGQTSRSVQSTAPAESGGNPILPSGVWRPGAVRSGGNPMLPPVAMPMYLGNQNKKQTIPTTAPAWSSGDPILPSGVWRPGTIRSGGNPMLPPVAMPMYLGDQDKPVTKRTIPIPDPDPEPFYWTAGSGNVRLYR